MIKIETALAFMKGLSSDEAKRMTVARLTGRDLTPAGDARLDEPPEDVLIEVLRAQPKQLELSAGIIRGCMEVYHLIEDALSIGDPKDWDADFIAMVRSLCSLVNLAHPEQLKNHARAMLSYVYPNEIPPDTGMHLVQAFMGYDLAEDDAPFWERLLESRDYAAFAFNALLRLDPSHPRLDRALAFFAEKKRNDGWTVDIGFLAKRMERARRNKKQELVELLWPQLAEGTESLKWLKAAGGESTISGLLPPDSIEAPQYKIQPVVVVISESPHGRIVHSLGVLNNARMFAKRFSEIPRYSLKDRGTYSLPNPENIWDRFLAAMVPATRKEDMPAYLQ